MVGLLAAALVATAAACSGGGGVAAGEEVDEVVIDVLSEPDSLDPLYRNTAEAQRYYRLVYSGLLRWKEDKSVAPDLAQLPTVSKDRLTYTLTLREGVKFHDGTPLTAQDVVFSYQQAADPKNGSVWLSSLEYMKSIKATNDQTVVITLTKPYAYLESRLALIPILSSENGYQANDTYARTGNGTGPFKLEKMTRGQSLVLVRNDAYFGSKPQYSSVTLKLVPENASRVARLSNGESQLAPGIPADQIDLIKQRDQHAEVVKDNVSRLFFYPSMDEDRPTANTDFRLAVAHAIDRSSIVDQVYNGAGRPNSTYLTYGTPHHDEDLGLSFGEKPNVAKAKEYLAKSGVKLDRKLSIIAANTPDLASAATIIQANLKKIGIDVEVETQEVAAFFPKLVDGNYDLILFNSPVTTSSGFAPDYVNGGLNSESANNFAKFSDAEMDGLLDTALTAQSEQDQAAAWKAVQQRDVETQGNIQLVISQTTEAWSKQLKGYHPSSLLYFNTLLDDR